MPNTRRRRFSVQTHTNIGTSRAANGTQTSDFNADCNSTIRLITHNPSTPSKNLRIKSKMSPIHSKINSLEILTESENEVLITVDSKQELRTKVDKDITASSSNIDLISAIQFSPPHDIVKKPVPSDNNSKSENHVPRTSYRDPNAMKRERYPRQHRIKVRSPKRRQSSIIECTKSLDTNKATIATNTLDSPTENEIINTEIEKESVMLNAIPDSEMPCSIEIIEPSNHSLDEMCRICHGGDSLVSEFGPMISACACRGTVGRVHVKCLEHWLTESGKSRCELCGTRYATRRVHRYGIPRALVMWLLSQNAKQLMVDSLGIMLMSPLAVLAAWLSGRTLAGLMTKDNEVAPWPLASTFVLACMTLVCYYCWIVSAVTRHALGWWIWYRSQYEVRLQILDSE